VETVGDCYVACCGRKLKCSPGFAPIFFCCRYPDLASPLSILLSVPNPRPDHATCMARFAQDILTRMSTLTNQLEVRLGPETGDLKLRIVSNFRLGIIITQIIFLTRRVHDFFGLKGIHSGPVTAGVLRGERARFQVSGKTDNLLNFVLP
jgi:Adenylate and Guanylate cyclase catalytic domain